MAKWKLVFVYIGNRKNWWNRTSPAVRRGAHVQAAAHRHNGTEVAQIVLHKYSNESINLDQNLSRSYNACQKFCNTLQHYDIYSLQQAFSYYKRYL